MSTIHTHVRPDSDSLKEKVRAFWSDHPCGVRFGGPETGSAIFFQRLEEHRYRLEPHILRAIDFQHTRGLRVLEIGCGLGTDAVQFARSGACYTGIDLTPVAVALTRERFGLLGLPCEVQVGDAEALDFESNSFDLVYSHGVLHHTPNIETAVSEIHRVLRPGGRAIVMLYNRQSMNHYIKVHTLRRLRAHMLESPWGFRLAQRMWPEPVEELHMHAHYARHDPGRYFRADVFLSRNTDGAACPLARVYSESEATELFRHFEDTCCRTYSRMHAWWPRGSVWQRVHSSLGSRWGWHLWIYARKAAEQRR